MLGFVIWGWSTKLRIFCCSWTKSKELEKSNIVSNPKWLYKFIEQNEDKIESKINFQVFQKQTGGAYKIYSQC